MRGGCPAAITTIHDHTTGGPPGAQEPRRRDTIAAIDLAAIFERHELNA
ncbi:hypothetical protein [Cutibacterium avidum]|nr:hypothetical protein [Cutibacterium avidum]